MSDTVADFSSGLIVEVARNGGRDPVQQGAPRGEFLIRCPWSENHARGDEHPSCRLHATKNTFYCDPCGRGGGVVQLARLLNVDLSSLRGAPTTVAKSRKKPLHFGATGPISQTTQKAVVDLLGKAYTSDAWKELGVLEGLVGDEPALAFPLPAGGYKACVYRRPNPKRGKPYTFWFTDGGKPELLMVGDGHDVLLVAGEWDMLAALSAGFPCVATGTAGEGTWKPEWSKRFKGKRVFIFYDVDDDGRRGGAKVAGLLANIADAVFVINLPLSGDEERDGNDLSDYLALHSADDLRALIANAESNGPYIPAAQSEEPSSDGTDFEPINEILRFVPEDVDESFRSNVFKRVLPLLTRLTPADQDLAMKAVKTKLGISLAAIRKEVESFGHQPDPDKDEADERNEPSKESLALLNDSSLIARFLDDTTKLGVVGEDFNKVALLLAMTSRMCDRPMNVVVKGESSAGKNHVVENVASCFPPSDVVSITALSPQALSYWDGDLTHKILLICETEGAERAEYTLRVFQSEGNLTVYYVAKVGGEMKTVEKTVKGPAATITTTTRETLHPENETRLVEIAIDESEEQTKRILEFQRQQRAKGVDAQEVANVRNLWRDTLKALECLPVIIPFADLVKFPTRQVRARRDFLKLMTLVEVSGFLHQRQRDRQDVHGRNHIVADIRDYALAYDLLHAFIERLQSGLNDRESRVLHVLQAEEAKLSVRDVAERLGWYQEAGRKRVKRCLESLQEKGHAEATDSKPGVATLYWFREAPVPSESGISTPSELAEVWAGRGGHLPTTWTSPLSRSKANI